MISTFFCLLCVECCSDGIFLGKSCWSLEKVENVSGSLSGCLILLIWTIKNASIWWFFLCFFVFIIVTAVGISVFIYIRSTVLAQGNVIEILLIFYTVFLPVKACDFLLCQSHRIIWFMNSICSFEEGSNRELFTVLKGTATVFSCNPQIKRKL